MAVTLRGVPMRERLDVTGDIQTTLKLPFTDYSLFYLSFSDGTLIEGNYDEERVYRFRLHTEGAGVTTIRREGDHDVIEVGWKVEWVTIASYEECAYPIREEEPLPVLPGLFENILERLKETAH